MPPERGAVIDVTRKRSAAAKTVPFADIVWQTGQRSVVPNAGSAGIFRTRIGGHDVGEALSPVALVLRVVDVPAHGRAWRRLSVRVVASRGVVPITRCTREC